MRRAVILAAMLIFASTTVPFAASAGSDGGCQEDAGDTFEDATAFCGSPEVNCLDDTEPYHPDDDEPFLCYTGSVDSSDRDDFYRIHLETGDQLVVDVYDASFWTEIELLDPNGVVVDDATGSEFTQLATSAKRVEVESAHVTGDYRLHVDVGFSGSDDYKVCIRPCEGPVGQQPNGLIWGPIRNPDDTQVLLVPPGHGDLGNPQGPTAAEYLNETLQALHDWEWALDRFAEDHPEYSYLENVSVEVDVFDGTAGTPIDPAGYDVVLGYVASGPTFRGIAVCCTSLQGLFDFLNVEDDVTFEGRYIALSLFAASPRAGQAMEDFPERNDLYGVTLHEFAHTWGVGHSLTWTHDHGPDLMNSPATFIYGDGDPAGDGGERTPRECISSLNLYAMAVNYDWMADGQYEGQQPPTVTLPSDIDYEMYCPPQGSPGGVLGAVPGV